MVTMDDIWTVSVTAKVCFKGLARDINWLQRGITILLHAIGFLSFKNKATSTVYGHASR